MKKLDKKDKKIKELTDSVDYWKSRCSDEKDDRNMVEGKLQAVKDEWNTYRQRLEGKELLALAENQWLRETLRMIMVSADKWDALLKKDPLNYRNTL